MSNLVYSNLLIYDEQVRLEKFKSQLKSWCVTASTAETGFGPKWLGNVVLNSGVGTVDMGLESDLRCKGSILNIEMYEDCLCISTETLWMPCIKLWVKLLEKYLPEATLTYMHDNEGLYTNDVSLVGKYSFDIWDYRSMGTELLEESFYGEKPAEEIVEILQQLLETEESNIETLIDEFEDRFIDSGCIHKWEYEPLETWG